VPLQPAISEVLELTWIQVFSNYHTWNLYEVGDCAVWYDTHWSHQCIMFEIPVCDHCVF